MPRWSMSCASTPGARWICWNPSWSGSAPPQKEDPARHDPGEQPNCTTCPVCAVLTMLRGGRSELAVRLADQVAGLLAVLRAALEEGAAPRRPTAADDSPPAGHPAASEGPPSPGSARPAGLDGNRFHGGSRPPHVQRIEVSRERFVCGGPHSLHDL